MVGSRIDYIIKTFQSIYDLSGIDIHISYGTDARSDTDILIIKSPLSERYFSSETDISPIQPAFKIWKGKSIPFLFNESSEKDIIEHTGDGVIINYDILGASFFLLSGYQEYKCRQKDSFNRFKYSESIQSRLGITTIPLVNYYFEILKEAIQNSVGKEILMRSPYRDKTTGFISHDIDNCKTGFVQDGLFSLKRGKIAALLSLLWGKLFKKDNWFNFSEIKSIEAQLGIKSTYFFLTRKGKVGHIPCADYDINTSELKKVILDLSDEGFEIGIHSPPSVTSADLLQEEMKKLPLKVKGNRNHFLLFDIASTTGILTDSTIKYDSTLGFPEHPGFRNSFCHPFYIYDHENERSSNILEIPLIIMDTTFKNYLKIDDFDEIFNSYFHPIYSEIDKFNGVLAILWHNNFFTEFKFKGYRNLFIKIISFLKTSGVSFKTGYRIITDHTDNENLISGRLSVEQP